MDDRCGRNRRDNDEYAKHNKRFEIGSSDKNALPAPGIGTAFVLVGVAVRRRRRWRRGVGSYTYIILSKIA